jgi:uncharacterized membrane protein YfcA
MDLSTDSLAIIFLALVAGSFVKGISGLGLPLTAIPVMAAFMPVEKAVAVMVIPSILINLYLLIVYRRHAVKLDNIVTLYIAGIAGVITGAILLSAVPNWYLILFMVLWLGAYLFSVLTKRKLRIPDGLSRHNALAIVGIGGLVQGAVGTSGPVITPYVHSLKLTQPQFVYAMSVLFQIFAITQLISFIMLGLIDQERAWESALACIPIAIFLPIAVWLSKFFSQRSFEIIVMTLLGIIEIRLIMRLFE